ncbi:hypothetical protein TRAPUB_8212 [Trametes pubescens]|uniref:Uncharacterized protein n=1 Tax=Trametes pubescens TaxID=154538 RepID=A0A1M2W5T7_TRAPU|nr:hypothetical protein TRAPUB_8212 [Trametes pubescens]
MASMPHMGMQFGPLAGIPPMSFSTMTWAPIADQQTLVMHGSNCPLCAEFLRHYAAGASEQSFRDPQTCVQTELQGRFWVHFERHTRSEGGRDPSATGRTGSNPNPNHIPVWMEHEFGGRQLTEFSVAFHLLSQQYRETLQPPNAVIGSA